MLLLYSIFNTEKGVKTPFQCTNMNKKIDKKITFIHNVYANCFKYMGLEELFTNFLSVGQSTDKAYTVALLYCCISTLGDANPFGSTANIRTCDKVS